MVHTESGHGDVFGMQEVSGRRSITIGEGVTVEVQQACKVVNMRAYRSRASSGEQGRPKLASIVTELRNKRSASTCT